MKPAAHISLSTLPPEEWDVIRPLWERLNQYHATLSSPFAAEMRTRTFEPRIRQLREKDHVGSVRIEIARTTPDTPPVAYCIASLTADRVGEIDSLFVDPDYRRMGIATTLMQRAADWLRDSGAVSQRVVVFHTNDEAVAFYRRFGFHPRNIELEQTPQTVEVPRTFP